MAELRDYDAPTTKLLDLTNAHFALMGGYGSAGDAEVNGFVEEVRRLGETLELPLDRIRAQSILDFWGETVRSKLEHFPLSNGADRVLLPFAPKELIAGVEAKYVALDEPSKQLFKLIMPLLVHKSDQNAEQSFVLKSRLREELETLPDVKALAAVEFDKILGDWAQAGIIMPPVSGNDALIQLSTRRLITDWPTLIQLLRADPRFSNENLPFAVQAEHWRKTGHVKDLLADDKIEAAKPLENLNPDIRAWVDASEKEVKAANKRIETERNQLKRENLKLVRLLIATMTAVAIVVVAALAVWLDQDANGKKVEAGKQAVTASIEKLDAQKKEILLAFQRNDDESLANQRERARALLLELGAVEVVLSVDDLDQTLPKLEAKQDETERPLIDMPSNQKLNMGRMPAGALDAASSADIQIPPAQRPPQKIEGKTGNSSQPATSTVSERPRQSVYVQVSTRVDNDRDGNILVALRKLSLTNRAKDFERLQVARGMNEVRYFNAEDEVFAKGTADALTAELGREIRPKNMINWAGPEKSSKLKGLLEVWVD